ncbi:hypothetical protein [Gluconobacter frateurii]|uniref:Uncharacterized protein n=1 Tax=Gluconobacter frateurii NRIC 0228 TaxID=1307946 RepID=A0ABQ0QFR5_9PROT|nr:hypothetical protein [Gluconobacter frateurii]GBR17473.1 hypothetical protein AA0228_3036 [Gluconobacter frateurii NRIC 0228]GLP89614.1 hypothetical protein GCM10007868_06890 [Gluconobacter frateurii]
MSSANNPAPFLDIKSVVNQLSANQDLFKYITAISDPKKFIDEIKPSVNQLPAVGITIEFGSVTDNLLNNAVAQVFEIEVCFTSVFNTSIDISGASSQTSYWNDALKALMNSIYNWQPSKERYLNGFQLERTERIGALCDNAYEVYCTYFDIKVQIDYTDGYLTEGQKLQIIQTQLNQNKNKQTTTINIQNK